MRMRHALIWWKSFTAYLRNRLRLCTHLQHAWLEDWVTKLVAADEISAYVEPRRAMAVLSHVGKPLQASDTLFMTEWVAIFRESGLRDDVSVENLREACLQLVVCARARAREPSS